MRHLQLGETLQAMESSMALPSCQRQGIGPGAECRDVRVQGGREAVTRMVEIGGPVSAPRSPLYLLGEVHLLLLSGPSNQAGTFPKTGRELAVFSRDF